MFDKPIDDIIAGDLQALVDARIPEGRRLEYKRDHYGRTDEAKREFAADVSAFANARGGYLLIGIAERNGIAAEVTGIAEEDSDRLVRAALDSIRTSTEPEILGSRARWIETAPGRGVLLIQIDRSWNAPHRVTVGRDNRFFLRDENGKHPMSVSELRRAFLFASEVEERIRQFRADRLALIEANEGPLALDTEQPRLVFHVVSRAAFTDNVNLLLDGRQPGVCPLGATGWNPMHSLDGLVSYSGPEGPLTSVRAYSTLFRNGIVEAVSKVHAGSLRERPSISLTGIERDLISGLRDCFRALSRYDVPAPFFVMMSLIGVRGLSAPVNDWGDIYPYPYRSDRLLVPEIRIDEHERDSEPSDLLRPVFDLLWNAFGQRASPNYDSEGRYVRR